MSKKITIEEKRKFIEKTGEWYNIHTADYWLRYDIKYSNPDWGGLSTESLYKTLTYVELPIVYKLSKNKIMLMLLNGEYDKLTKILNNKLIKLNL